MVVIVGGPCFLHWLMFIIIFVLMVLDNWLTLVICDSLVMMWLDYSFMISVIIASVIVILSRRDMLGPVLLSNHRFTISLFYMSWIPLTFILLLINELHIMADWMIRWLQV